MKNEIILSNLDRLVDPKCIDDKDPNLWKTTPYEAEGRAGVMLVAGGGSEPVPITLRLGVKGLHRIWLGIAGFLNAYQLRVKMSDDLCCRTICPPKKMDRISEPFIYEVFFKESDLTNQDLILEGTYRSDLYPGALAYIRLEPVGQTSGKSNGTVCCPLAVTNDGHGIMAGRPHKRPEDLLEDLDAIERDSCMRILLWGAGNADNCNYPTEVGTYITAAPGSYANIQNDTYFRNLRLWKDKGWDTLKLVRDYSKSRSWEFHVYIRMEAFYAHRPFDFIRSDFFTSHPEYHCCDRNGQPVLRLSYAYPEVQEHMLNLIREISNYDPDGVCLCFVRGLPLVLYEETMVEGFVAEYGTNPRELDELDQRWLDYQAAVITPFLKNVRAALKSGQRLSVIVPGNEMDCRRWGLDVASWVMQGLIDDLYPVGQRFNEEDVHIDAPEKLDFNFFNTLAKRENIRLIPMLYPWAKFGEDYEGWTKLMHAFMTAGANGYGVWDAVESAIFPKVGYLGYGPQGKPVELETKRVKLMTLGNYRYDRYHYFEVI